MSGDYKKVVSFLESFINYERSTEFAYQKSLKLERVKRLFNTLKIDVKELPAIHIAGTKGKGSTATFLSFILASCGFKVGLYTSPHFSDFRERIVIVESTENRVQSTLIPKRDVVGLASQMRPVLEKSKFHGRFGELSFFEIYTALALKYFLKEKVEFAVLETGMGGRLDATNVVKPLLSIITHIGYDHTRQLGKTLREIAREKAGIIKKRIPVVTAHQANSSLKVLIDRVKRYNTHLYIYGKDFLSGNTRLTPRHTIFDFFSGLGELRDVKISLIGEHQVENASLAIFAAQLLKKKYNIKDSSIRRGLSAAFLEGRFQIIENKKDSILLDIAHNPLSIAALNKAIKTYFVSRKITLIFGCSQDKDVKNMLKNIEFDNIILTKAENLRAQDPHRIERLCKLRDCYIKDEPKEALYLAKQISDDGSLIVATGSIFLIADLKSLLRK